MYQHVMSQGIPEDMARQMIMHLASGFWTMAKLNEVIQNFKAGGVWIPKYELLMNQNYGAQQYKNRPAIMGKDKVQSLTTNVDQVSQANHCSKEESQLKQVTIKDLKPKQVAKDSILWVDVISDPVLNVGLSLVVQDKNGDCIQLAMYNQTPTTTKFNEA